MPPFFLFRRKVLMNRIVLAPQSSNKSPKFTITHFLFVIAHEKVKTTAAAFCYFYFLVPLVFSTSRVSGGKGHYHNFGK
jgi:hypothetical protein